MLFPHTAAHKGNAFFGPHWDVVLIRIGARKPKISLEPAADRGLEIPMAFAAYADHVDAEIFFLEFIGDFRGVKHERLNAKRQERLNILFTNRARFHAISPYLVVNRRIRANTIYSIAFILHL